MKNYYRIMLGKASVFAEQGYNGNFVGVDFLWEIDLTGKLPDNWREFNHAYIPVFMEKNPNKTKIAAGLACGALWTLAKGIQKGDIVLTPNGQGQYYVGEIMDNYSYHKDEDLTHRRTVKWLPVIIERSEMSEGLRNSTGNIGTLGQITKHAEEIERFIGKSSLPVLTSTDASIEDPSIFALEKHLESFLVENWAQTELGKKYDIFQEEGELVGQQYLSDSGPIDILAISKDKKELLVVELKKGRASDNVVGQIQRYMGYVLQELAEENQTVKGIIIALEDDNRIKRALAVAPNIEFYRYQVTFKLFKN